MLGIFTKSKRPELRIVIDIGPHRIKALAFEYASYGRNRQVELRLKVLKKLLIELPKRYDAVKSIRKLHELLFKTLKEFERVPEEIIISPNLSMYEYSLEEWNFKEDDNKFKNEFKNGVDIANLSKYFAYILRNKPQNQIWEIYPTGFAVNGYRIKPDEPFCNLYPVNEYTGFDTDGDNYIYGCSHYALRHNPRKIENFSIYGIILKFRKAIGEELEHIKQGFGGLPIQFIPSILAEKYAFSSVLKASNLLLIDVEEDDTILTLLKCGNLAGVRAFPLGSHNLTGEEGEKTTKDKLEFWRENFIKSLEYFYAAGPLPRSVALFGKGADIEELRKILASSGWLEKFSYTDSPKLSVINAETFLGGNSWGGILTKSKDAVLAMLMIYSICVPNKMVKINT